MLWKMDQWTLIRRHSNLTDHSQRITSIEIAAHWFRRGSEFARTIHEMYPDFPQPGPDGLYLLDDVRSWFERYHGKRQTFIPSKEAEAEALRIARHGRRQYPTPTS